MKPHIEQEYKMMLDKKIFDKIIEKEDFDLVIQENYYYDLGSDTKAMRIRNIEDMYILTIKEKKNGQMLEYEYQVDDENINKPEINSLLEKLNIKQKPIYLGSMLTCRYYKKFKQGEMVLDLSKYLNHIDYEIEYELYDHKTNSNQELINFLNKYKIEYIVNNRTKFQRFKEALNERN